MMLFNKKSEISTHNLVNRNNRVEPKYELGNQVMNIKLCISPAETVTIIGQIDNNYCCWCSVTHLFDVDVNEEIFNFITTNDFDTYSHEYVAIGTDTFSDIMDGYRLDITRSSADGIGWVTPFGNYSDDPTDGNRGKFFSKVIIRYYEGLVEMCRFRLNEGHYIAILENYLHILKTAEDYKKVEALTNIVKDEQYLRLSPDVQVRELYIKCANAVSLLYNRYMDQIRG